MTNTLAQACNELASRIIPARAKEPTTTSSLLIKGALHPKKMQTIVADTSKMVVDSFPDGSPLRFLASLTMFQATSWFFPEAAKFATYDENLAVALKELPESRDNMAVIQSAPNYLVNFKYLEDELVSKAAETKKVKDDLAKSMFLQVMPLASPQDWFKVLEKLVAIHPGNNSTELPAKLKAMFEIEDHEVANSTGTIEALNCVKRCLASCGLKLGKTQKVVLSDEWVKLKFDVLNSYGVVTRKSDQEKTDFTRMGHDQRAISFPELIAVLQRDYAIAQEMGSYSRVAELNASVLPALSFSFGAPGVPSRLGARTTATNEGAAAFSEGFTVDDAAKAVESRWDQDRCDDGRNAALSLFILNYAGANLRVAKSDTVAVTRENSFLQAPVAFHPLNGYFALHLENIWKSFLPKVPDLAFLNKAFKMAGARTNAPMQRNAAVNSLTVAIQTDLQDAVKAIREGYENGFELPSGNDLLGKKHDTLLYKNALITHFSETVLQSSTDREDFVNTGSVNMTSSLPIGSMEIPTAPSRGFAEAVLVYDAHSYDLITESGSVQSFASLHNAINRASNVVETERAFSSSIADMMAAAHLDLLRSARPTDLEKPRRMHASGLVNGMALLQLDDYIIQDYAEETQQLRLDGSRLVVSASTSTLDTLSDSLTFGVYSGSSAHMASKLDHSVAKAVNGLCESFVSLYAMKPLTLNVENELKLDVIEENAPYGKRLGKVDELFEKVEIDLPLIRIALTAPVVGDHLASEFSMEHLRNLRHCSIKLRKDAKTILDSVATAYAQRLKTSNGSETVTLYAKAIQGNLSLKDRAVLRDNEHKESHEALVKSIAKVLAAVKNDDIVKAIFFSELVAKLSALDGDDDKAA